MNQIDKAAAAILSAFPTVECFTLFYQNKHNTPIGDSFIDFAVRNVVINTPDAESLEQFIRTHTDNEFKFRLTGDITFEELLNKKEETLNLNLSLRALCNRINAILTTHRIGLPRVTHSMLMRLKKESLDTDYKMNVLRSIAFWLGYERTELSRKWNFETLVSLFPESGASQKSDDHTEGVRIGFSLTSRGEVIDHEIIGWLKKNIKSYITEAIGHFLYGKWGKVKAYDITTLYIDFPKEREGGNLVHYMECLKSAVALAHQIAVRWPLSKYYSKNRFLSIAITAGEYGVLENHLLSLLNASLPDDPMIRISDYARHGLLINDIHVILCQKPVEARLFNGESLPIWWITSLWTTHYFDFVSELLHDETLQNTPASIEKLDRLLWPMGSQNAAAGHAGDDNAIATFFKYPHHSLLGVEIAKTLYYRKRCSEAAEILRIVLSINPKDLVARTLRMMLLRNMALDTPSHRTAAAVFRQAIQEADNIREHCDFHTEDFYCEYAIVYLAQAMSTVRHMRTHPDLRENLKEFEKLQQAVYQALDQAKQLFEKGMSVSSSGTRSSFLLKIAAVLKTMLESDKELFVNPEKPITGGADIFQQESMDVQWQIGYRRSELPVRQQDELVAKITIQKGVIYNAAISLFSYQPTTLFCNAVALWDFLPVHTVLTAKIVRERIENAIDIARQAEEEKVGIYAFNRTYSEIIPADVYIEHMQKALKIIDEEVGGDLTGREDSEVITAMADGRPPKLFTLNF
jgi:tetratricopeptide (TPR) repeat protein